MDTEVISQCVGPLPRDYLSKCAHHVTPCTNLHTNIPNNDSMLHLKPCSFVSSLPVPITLMTLLNREVTNGIDPTTTLIRKKLKWQIKKDKLLGTVRADKKKMYMEVLERAMKTYTGGVTSIPQGVALLAQHLDSDPDPNFSGFYNWYYTGGALARIHQGDNHFLLHTTQSDINCSRIIKGKMSDELSSSVHLEDDEPIFQTATNSDGTVVVRQRSAVSILSCQQIEDGRTQLEQIHRVFDKNHHFVSVTVPDGPPGRFASISSTRILKLWDIECNKKYTSKCLVESKKGVSETDSWSTLHYLNPNTLLLADRCCIHVLDVRTSVDEKQLAWCSKELIEQCEEQCNMIVSSVEDRMVYTPTNHQLLCLDLRQGYSQRWTHMLASPPHLATTRRTRSRSEVVCLGSQLMADCVAVVNSWSDGGGQSWHRPTGLPGPAESLHCARQYGLCLDPSLTDRCNQSMIGLTSMASDNGLYLMRQSATGDVFMQELSASGTVGDWLSKSELKSYSQWCHPHLRDISLPTPVSCTYNYRSLLTATEFNVTSNTALEMTDVSYSSCQISKQYMEDCVDLLAGKLLAVWQVEDEDEWLEEEGSSFIQQDPEEKVIKWLQMADNLDEPIVQNGPDQTVLKESLKTNKQPTPSPSRKPIISKIKKEKSPNSSENSSLYSPWMLKPSQVPRSEQYCNPQVENTYVSQDTIHYPRPSSISSQRKKEILEDNVLWTPKKVLAPAKQTVSALKKKFIPGF